MRKPANDNNPISGKAAHAWPALTRAVTEGNYDFGEILVRFARLFDLANMPPEAVPSPAGKYHELAASGLANLVEESSDASGGEQHETGGQLDFCVEYGKTPEALCALANAGCYSMVTRNDARAGVRHESFRVKHVSYNAEVDGQITQTFHSWAEYRGKDGNWYRLEETLKRPRGPQDGGDEWQKWTHTVHPSGKSGATHNEYPAEQRLEARQLLEWLRGEIGDDAYEVLRLAASERSTAQAIGETRGKTYKRASALGTKLTRDALTAANRNWKFSETG